MALFSSPEAPGAWSPGACGLPANRSAGRGLTPARGAGAWSICWGRGLKGPVGLLTNRSAGHGLILQLRGSGGVVSKAYGGVASRPTGARAWPHFRPLGSGGVASRGIEAQGVASFSSPEALGAWSPGGVWAPGQ